MLMDTASRSIARFGDRFVMSSTATHLSDLRANGTTLRDKHGQAYVLRSIRPADAPALVRAYDAMSDDDKWFRMLQNIPHLSDEMARHFCAPDPQRDLCVVIEGRGALAGEILGGARIAGEGEGCAEFSVSLRPEAQSLGLGFAALEIVLIAAHDMGFRHVWGVIAAQNKPMRTLAQRLGFKLVPSPNDLSLIRADMDLPVQSVAPKLAA